MRPDNELDMAVSSMLNGKHPLAALNRMTNNMTSFLKHSVYTIYSHIIVKGAFSCGTAKTAGDSHVPRRPPVVRLILMDSYWFYLNPWS